MFDIIGDIHGFSETLELMLKKLGYNNSKGYYEHSERKAVFVGDFIDRGKSVREVLQIVKAMTDNGTAFAVLGNHEYNAVAFHTKNGSGNFLREHSPKNIHQHKNTLEAFKNFPLEFEIYLNWFKTLPFFLEFDDFNVVHACWDNKKINYIKQNYPENCLTDEFLHKSADKLSFENQIAEILLKGIEIELPPGIIYTDKDGFPRNSIRRKWWLKPDKLTYRQIAVSYENQIPDIKIPPEYFNSFKPYLPDEKPVFFGHYWKSGKPEIQSPNVCCVDYSLAKCKQLVAYRYNGEKYLDNKNFISVNCVDK